MEDLKLVGSVDTLSASNPDSAREFPAHRLATASPNPTRYRQWWVAQCRPQYEERLVSDIAALAQKLDDLNLFAFSPREQFIRSRKDDNGHFHHEDRTRLIFPTYVFYTGDRDAAFASSALIQVLKTTQRDDEDIENLLLAVNGGPVRRASRIPLELRGIKVGRKVKVVSGPFMGTVGLVDRFGDTRIVLTVGTLGGAEIVTDLRHIEPIWGD